MNPIRKCTLVLAICALALYPLWECPGQQMYDFEKMARGIVNMLNVAGYFIAQNLDVINTHNAKLGQPIPEGQPYSHKGIDPVTFATAITKNFTLRTGIVVRFVSEGKGDYGPRDSNNLPDEWEQEEINRFKELNLPPGVGFGEFLRPGITRKVIYRYFFPLYINELCLKCHGDPATSPTKNGKDVTGHTMENYKLGDLRGGISLVFPVQ